MAARSAARPGARAARDLARLERLRDRHGVKAAREKRALVARLARARLATAAQVLRLHEALLFLEACPDDARVHAAARAALRRFARRPDLARHRDALADSGIAGTAIAFPFFAPTAGWLARRWPDRLRIAWDDFERADRLEGLLGVLAHPAESAALDALDFPTRDWVARLAGPRTSDAAWLASRFAALRVDGVTRERLYDDLDVPLVLAPGPTTPSRTLDRWAGSPTAFVPRGLDRSRPGLARAVAEPPRAVRALGPRDGERMLDLARAAMATRSRDLDAFAWGDPRDVRLVDFGDGLQFAAIGLVPERRLLFEAVYGYLTLRNGVPAGYVLSSALYASAEIAYNVFDTWRGGDAGRVFGRVLAMVRHLFGATAFSIDPFQLGHANDEALDSGAWWFYRKMGFAPRAAAARTLARREQARLARDRAHRSSRTTLERLAEHPLYWFAGRSRADVLSVLPLERASLAASRRLAARFGADREAGEAAAVERTERRLGVRSTRSWTADERRAWRRWAPVLDALPGVDRWRAPERRALVELVRAKGGRRESDFAARFDAHPRLRRALATLARRTRL